MRVIRRLVEQDCVVGLIADHNPDFEFANFTVTELAEVAAGIDDANGWSRRSFYDAIVWRLQRP